MTHTYPFRSTFKAQLTQNPTEPAHFVWQKTGVEIQKLFSAITEPIVEIGGPSDLGYYFLDDTPLPREVTITNLNRNPLPFHPQAKELAGYVNAIVDGRATPYNDASLGMILISHLSLADDHADQHGVPHNVGMHDYDQAVLEIERTALGITDTARAHYSQSLPIYQEVARTLVPGGLLLANGLLADGVVLQQMGFELLALLQVKNEPSGVIDYEFLLRR